MLPARVERSIAKCSSSASSPPKISYCLPWPLLVEVLPGLFLLGARRGPNLDKRDGLRDGLGLDRLGRRPPSASKRSSPSPNDDRAPKDLISMEWPAVAPRPLTA